MELPSNAASAIALRPVLPEDKEFLHEVYASTRADELSQVAWSETQLKAFLKMQLNARDQSYRMHYHEIDDRIILFRDHPIGRLIMVRTNEEIRLADIALLPEHRGSGMGTSLIKDLMNEASNTKRPIRLQVEKTNMHAKRLYHRLGFTTMSENMTHVQMEYQPGA
ncbi:MAG: GNAT family N-acetyltransferase [Acidobacteria bacterium]|nr:GNAT family N-acetyltransferase [Acidobacteriota bacterium]